jgi:hypothetical protein
MVLILLNDQKPLCVGYGWVAVYSESADVFTSFLMRNQGVASIGNMWKRCLLSISVWAVRGFTESIFNAKAQGALTLVYFRLALMAKSSAMDMTQVDQPG